MVCQRWRAGPTSLLSCSTDCIRCCVDATRSTRQNSSSYEMDQIRKAVEHATTHGAGTSPLLWHDRSDDGTDIDDGFGGGAL